MLKFLQFFFIPIIISINSNNFNKLINKSEYIDFKIEEKTVFQYLINLFNRNEKIQIYNYNDSNYDYQKTIEDNLKKQIN
ncbi:hypothetical protein [Spiroplasma endosymbiont of Lonchoptera lutea]|uniref:hypothetical protein n=1 Tax=Spiroplasma endosymbiont of Lonchoptera lutea TaxID=3066297 RepID=UPI0030D1272D